MEPVSVAAKVGVTPLTRLLFTSRSVIVTVEVATPLAVAGPVPVIVELAATGAPATKLTLPVTLPRPAGVAMLTVFVPLSVEARVATAWPDAFVTDPG